MYSRVCWHAAVAAAALVGAAPACAQDAPEPRADSGTYPRETWLRYAAPEEAGWSASRLAAALAYADSVGSAAGMHPLHGGPEGHEIRGILLRLLRARVRPPTPDPQLVPSDPARG